MDIAEQIWLMTDTNTIKTIIAVYESQGAQDESN
jgi:hypothetical protein